MKHSFYKVSILLVMLMAFIQANAHDFEVDGIYYVKTSDNSVSVSYRGSNSNSYLYEYTGNVEIPEAVEYSGISYSVTAIGGYAFSGCSSLTSITIPESVTYIFESAFYGCLSLSSISIPESVTAIYYSMAAQNWLP